MAATYARRRQPRGTAILGDLPTLTGQGQGTLVCVVRGGAVPDTFHYEGFSSPLGTIVPDDVFDVLMPQLADPELRVLLYIIRRTFGFKRDHDDISLKQMV